MVLSRPDSGAPAHHPSEAGEFAGEFACAGPRDPPNY